MKCRNDKSRAESKRRQDFIENSSMRLVCMEQAANVIRASFDAGSRAVMKDKLDKIVMDLVDCTRATSRIRDFLKIFDGIELAHRAGNMQEFIDLYIQISVLPDGFNMPGDVVLEYAK